MRPSGAHRTAGAGLAVAGLAAVGPCPPDSRYSKDETGQKGGQIFMGGLASRVPPYVAGPRFPWRLSGPTVIDAMLFS